MTHGRRRPPVPHVFDLPFQHGDPDSKVVAAAERVGQAMEGLLRRAAQEEGLTPLQARVLLFLAGQGETNRRPGEIARSLGVTAPTVTDALNALASKGLLGRSASPEDGRVRTLDTTPAGRKTAGRLAGWADPAREAMGRVPEEVRGEPIRFLTAWIEEMLRAGIVTVARMCVTCRHFDRDAHPGRRARHHCRLLDVPLTEGDLRVDCPEHEAAAAT